MFKNITEEMNSVNDFVYKRGVTIAAQCRVEIQGKFFLLLAIEAGSGIDELERVIIIEISKELFHALKERVELCEVRKKLPDICACKKLELKCTFVVECFAYLVFEVESRCICDRLVIVKSPICQKIC